MPPMDEASSTEFAALLAERRAEIEAALQVHEAGSLDIRLARSDGTADDEHDPEGSTLSGEWALVEALKVGEQRELDEIDAAMQRLGAGTYGVCAACGRGIPHDRLRARPMAALCVACAERAHA